MPGLNIAEIISRADEGDEDAMLFITWNRAIKRLDLVIGEMEETREALEKMENVLRKRVGG